MFKRLNFDNTAFSERFLNVYSSLIGGSAITKVPTPQVLNEGTVDNDVDAMVQILGEHCLADGAKDWLYRGAGRNNLLYASQLDVDVENALERSPFNDVIVLDDPNAADDTEGDE